jgi:pimeloyl-ACP methyl ester carboxylesterase
MPHDVWETRTWDEVKAETQARAERGAYPVFGIKPEDARAALANVHGFDPEQWGTAWMRLGERYEETAGGCAQNHDLPGAITNYLAAWRLYTLGRWPVAKSPSKAECLARARRVFETYGGLVDPKIEPVSIPFEASAIRAYLQIPPGPNRRPPVVINIGGSDLWKDSVAMQARGFLQFGIAALAVDMPGTNESPVPARPGSERVFSAVIDYLQTCPDVDGSRIMVRGQSWGSYWSARTAYAEAARMAGAVFQSGPVHLYFQRSWQEQGFKTKEFLFDYVPSRLHMLGVHTVEEAFDLMPALSLLDAGLLEKPTPPMLLIGGAKDTQVPFSDFLLMLQNGSPKYAWVNPEGGTMGRSLGIKDDDIFANVVAPWVRQQFGL